MSISFFDLYFPLPYRICFTVLFGSYLWGVNVQCLTHSHIDVQSLIRYNHQGHDRHSFYKAIYHFSTVLTTYVAISWLIFVAFVSRKHLSQNGLADTIRFLDLVPVFTLFGLILAFFLPGPIFHASGRRRLLGIFKRILLGGLDANCRFADILIADVLTSYNKVFLDLVYTSLIFLAGQSSLTNPNRNYGGDLVAPITMGFPSLIRLSQCSIDYMRSGATIHLLNCLKYASAFPILIMALFLKKYKNIDSEDRFFTERTFFNLWAFASFFNSLYSFYWDVTNDWGLELFSSFPSYRYHGLRRVKMLNIRVWYYVAVLVDLALRAVWIMKLTYSWKSFPDLETGLFVLEILEVSRRAMWVYFRTEKEWTTSDISIKEDDFDLPLYGR